MRFRLRRIVYFVGVFSLFMSFSLFTYQNFGTYYVEIGTDSNIPMENKLVNGINIENKAYNILLKNMTPPKLPSAKVISKMHSNENLIWPDKNQPWDDRILKQMYFVPSTYRKTDRIIHILRPGGLGDDPGGQTKFLMEECPVDRCFLTADINSRLDVDAVVYQNDYITYTPVRKPNQIWILWLLESPINSFVLTPLANQLNWTATYRMDSTIVTPYAKFVHFDNFTGLKPPQKDYSERKTKSVAWFVSNCNSANKRFQYAIELQKYIQVDIYGACGTLECPRYREKQCFEKLSKEYRFYLSFENSNCQYYITEKFFLNALENDVIPVVMGGRKEDYLAVTPPGSFIHIEDFENVRELAEYLHQLSENKELYNQYFRWKGTGHFINTKFWCRVCAMLHAVIGSGVRKRGNRREVTKRWYSDAEHWWRNNHTCTNGNWNDEEEFIKTDDWKHMLGAWE